MVQKVLKSGVFRHFLGYFAHTPFGGVWAEYVLEDPLTCSGGVQKVIKKGSKSGILGVKSDTKRCPKSDLIFGHFLYLHLSTFAVNNEALFGPKIDQKWVIFDVIFDQKRALFWSFLSTPFDSKYVTFRP